MYKNNHVMKTCRYHLGTSTKHTVYEAELVGIILALFLLASLSCQLLGSIVIGLDNQASIRALANQESNQLNISSTTFTQQSKIFKPSKTSCRTRENSEMLVEKAAHSKRATEVLSTSPSNGYLGIWTLPRTIKRTDMPRKRRKDYQIHQVSCLKF